MEENMNRGIDDSLVNMVRSCRNNPGEGLDVYDKVRNEQKKVKRIPQNNMRKKKVAKKSHGAAKLACIGLLVIASSVATRLYIGSENIANSLKQSNAIEWFDARYTIGTIRNSDRAIIDNDTHEATNYEVVVDKLVDKMVVDENIDVNKVAPVLDKMGIPIDEVNKSCARMGLEQSTFMGRASGCWDAAVVDVEELENMDVKGVSR
ncbi:MAG: hypothetical protein IJ509_02870 [Bacilli bacterium]|nr:hypothetical protein [Bacilli bacterium]